MLYVKNATYNYMILMVFDILLYATTQVVLLYRRISKGIKEEQEHALTKIYAFSDELTKLGNRRKFYLTVEKMEKNGLPDDLTVIMIDCNRLKYYNDTWGHEAGDEVISTTANFIKDTFESFEDANICRIGGDEFAVTVVASKEQVSTAVSAFKTKLKAFRGEYVMDLTASVGYARLSDYPDSSFEELQNKADEAMYKDKQIFYKTSGLDRRK